MRPPAHALVVSIGNAAVGNVSSNMWASTKISTRGPPPQISD